MAEALWTLADLIVATGGELEGRAAGGAAEIDSSAAWGTSVRVTWPAASPALRLV